MTGYDDYDYVEYLDEDGQYHRRYGFFETKEAEE